MNELVHEKPSSHQTIINQTKRESWEEGRVELKPLAAEAEDIRVRFQNIQILDIQTTFSNIQVKKQISCTIISFNIHITQYIFEP